ncbi:unnamed protein product [Camellia sinensis]
MRATIAERKRATIGDPFTGKLKHKPQPLSISGKHKRKLFKKWMMMMMMMIVEPEQKDAMGKGLVTMQNVEMAIAEAKHGE